MVGLLGCRQDDFSNKTVPSNDAFHTGRKVASVNESSISYAEFQISLQHAKQVMSLGAKGLSSASERVLARKLLDKMIDAHLLAQHALRIGIEEPGMEQCERELARIMRGEEKNSYFYRFLRDQGISTGVLSAHYRREWMIDRLSRRLGAMALHSVDELRSFYQKNQMKYRKPAMVELAHIAFTKTKNGKAPMRRAMDAKVALGSGLSFAQAVSRYSDDELTRDGSGRLGLIQKGEMLSRLDEIAFSLREGEISDPVEVASGVYLLKVIKRMDGTILPFEKVRDDIAKIIEKQAVEQHLYRLAEDLRKKAKIKIFDNIPE